MAHQQTSSNSEETEQNTKPKMQVILSDADEDDSDTDERKTRSCCGCFFCLFILWIWASVLIGLVLNELGTREITVTTTNKTVTLTCGWQFQYYMYPTNNSMVVDYYKTGSKAKTAGVSYFVLTIFMSPFLLLLTSSCCLPYGTEDEPLDDDILETKENMEAKWDKSQKCYNKINRLFKIIGIIGTFVCAIAAYVSFATVLGDCSSPPSNTTAAGDPRIGRTLALLLSAVVISMLLIIVVILLVILLTAENADQLGFAGAIAALMGKLGCGHGCPEFNGAIGCKTLNVECGGSDTDCCCCCNS